MNMKILTPSYLYITTNRKKHYYIFDCWLLISDYNNKYVQNRIQLDKINREAFPRIRDSILETIEKQ